ncbi:MAG: hypothetical protein U9R60_13800 [Bacteroidota bacterium]|nr:hypothetical protein [Bacteroidota bacterium]
MKHLIPFFLLVFFLASISGVQGQTEKKFTRSNDAYSAELSAMFATTGNKRFLEKSAVLMDQFNAYWASPFYTRELREKIYDISDLMLEKRMYAFPRFFDFVSCLVYLGERRVDKESINIWLVRTEYLVQNVKDRDYGKFLTSSLVLLKDKIMYQNQTRNWYYKKGKFTFSYDTAFLVHFEEIDLIGRTRQDSTVIKATTGVLHSDRHMWYGNGGMVTWERVGLDAEMVFAKLRDYKIDISLIRYTADSVELQNKNFFKETMMGRLEERVSSSKASEKASFPRFDPYFKNYLIKDIIDNIDAEGGISMQGRKIICNSKDDDLATLYFRNENGNDVRFRANEFIFLENMINAERTQFTLYHGPDSLHHPGIQMRYNVETKQLELIQTNPGNTRIPFYDSFHDLDIYSETLVWDLGANKMAFKAIQSVGNESQVVFASDNFFSEYDFYHLQGVDIINPLDVVKDFTEAYGTMEISPVVMAEYVKKPTEQVIAMLLRLEGLGFVVFDPDIEIATVKQRLFDYLDAKAGYIDWDVIRFESITRLENNAEIDLENFNMEILGVQEVSLSHPQKVYIYPYHGNLTITKGRDFVFSGQVKAGLFEFYTDSCFFDYDSFNLKLPDIDSVSFYVRLDSINEDGMQLLQKVKTVIEDLRGYIEIDNPLNKSATVQHPQYPIFVCESNAYVYYDDSYIRNGVYDRESFYYELEPFVIDSLDNFKTDNIKFKGYLESAGIFPIIDQDLVVMPDYSLGFMNEAPTEGYPLYGPLANYQDTLYLGASGLTGTGEMTFLNSTTLADNFVFYPDSLRAVAGSFKLRESAGEIEYPSIEGTQIDETLLPDTAVLVLKNTDEPFSVFANESEFDGTLYLSEGIVDGEGFYIFENSSIASNQFHLRHHEIAADTADFCLYTDSTFSDTAFVASRYRSKVDFFDRLGYFYSTGIHSLLEFPFNQYVGTMDELEWNMDAYEMVMNNHAVARTLNLDEVSMYDMVDLDLTGSEFISTHPEQDSLKFFTVKAQYDMTNNIIFAQDVRIIKVADAAIFPRDGLVTIQENALMETLKNAYILADTNTKFHVIHNANVNIYSRHEYLAKGFYDFIDYTGEIHRIKLNNIAVDSTGMSYAEAIISDSLNFMLSPEYYFMGNVRLEAQVEFLSFDGGYRIYQECYNQPEYWVRFDTLIDPNTLVFPVPDNMLDIYGERLYSSLNFSRLKKGFYPCFFEEKWNSKDTHVLGAHGYMGFDSNTESFIISDNLFGDQSSSREQYLILDEKYCTLQGEGRINLPAKLPYMDIKSYGQANYMVIPDSTKLKLVAGFDFYLDEELMEMITESFKLTNLRGINVDNEFFSDALEYFLSPEEAQKYQSDIQLYGVGRKIPQELRYTLFVADLNFIWNPSTHSFISRGDIGIANMGTEPINKYVNAYIEIGIRESGDYINIYLELTKGLWYFFTYRHFIMQTISSDEAYNTVIMDMKDDRRIINDRREDEPYEIVISSKRKRVEFLRDMEKVFDY